MILVVYFSLAFQGNNYQQGRLHVLQNFHQLHVPEFDNKQTLSKQKPFPAECRSE